MNTNKSHAVALCAALVVSPIFAGCRMAASSGKPHHARQSVKLVNTAWNAPREFAPSDLAALAGAVASARGRIRGKQ